MPLRSFGMNNFQPTKSKFHWKTFHGFVSFKPRLAAYKQQRWGIYRRAQGVWAWGRYSCTLPFLILLKPKVYNFALPECIYSNITQPSLNSASVGITDVQRRFRLSLMSLFIIRRGTHFFFITARVLLLCCRFLWILQQLFGSCASGGERRREKERQAGALSGGDAPRLL
jgi:hypothetical protein